MIEKSSPFRKLVETLRGLPLGDPLGEILLLFAWQHLERNKPNRSLPKLNDVINGKITLKNAFLKVGEQLDGYHAFTLSALSDMASPAQSKQLCQAVKELAETDKFELVKACLDLRLESGLNKGSSAFENDLLELMIDLAEANAGEIFVPYSINMQLAILAAQRGLRVFYSHSRFDAFTEAAALILGLRNENHEAENDPDYMFGDAPLKESKQKYSSIVLIPPFGLKVEFERKKVNSEVVSIDNALAKCTGSLIALVPQGVMFRSGDSSELRRDIVLRKFLKTVIQLPPSMVRGSSIALSILVLQTNAKPSDGLFGKVRFIDSTRGKFFTEPGRGSAAKLMNARELVRLALHKSGEKKNFWRDADVAEIAEKHFDLSVSQYVLGRASQEIEKLSHVVPLEKIATLVRGQLLREEKVGDVPVKTYFEVGVRDIGESGYISKPEKLLELTEGMVHQAEKQKLLPGDILLVSKGSVGKVGIVGSDCGDNWVASQSFQIIRLKDASTVTQPEYLFMFLSSELMQVYFKEHVTGTTIPVLKTQDIKTLPVPLPPLDEQESVVKKFRSIMTAWASIKRLKSEVQEIQKTCWGLN